jgi:hypothetical protein
MFLPIHPYSKNVLEIIFFRPPDALHVYRTRYSLDIELKTLHSECSLQIVFVTGSDLTDDEAKFQQNSRNDSFKRYPLYTRLVRLVDHPARSELLYQLRYPSPRSNTYTAN